MLKYILTSWVSLPVVISLSSSALPSQSLSTRSPLKPKVWLHFWNKHVRERMRYLALIFFCSKIYVWKMYLWTQFENCLRFGGKRLFEILWLSFVIRDLKRFGQFLPTRWLEMTLVELSQIILYYPAVVQEKTCLDGKPVLSVQIIYLFERSSQHRWFLKYIHIL